MSYPQDVAQVHVLTTANRERSVRLSYLSGIDKRGFGIFLEAMSKGTAFETALGKGFGLAVYKLGCAGSGLKL